MTEATPTTGKTPKAKQPPRPDYSRKTLRKMGRDKKKAKLKTDKEFATAYFAGKSKRSDEKKTAFRKRYAKK